MSYPFGPGGRLHDSGKIKSAYQLADGGHEYKTAQWHGSQWLQLHRYCWLKWSIAISQTISPFVKYMLVQ